VIDLIPSSVDPTLPLKSETQVVDPVPRSIDPTPPSKSEDVAQVFLVTTDSSRQGGIPPFPMTPPPSNVITIDWNALTEPRLPSYMPFQIIVQVCGRNIPNTIIDEELLLASYPRMLGKLLVHLSLHGDSESVGL
jgi:hypothetical protein